jgi:hypothetical protein
MTEAIRASGLTIYDLAKPSGLRLSTTELETILNDGLRGLNLNYPIRTRSKVLKGRVCEVLGYPIPTSFRRTKPRFPGQDFDTYVQKSNNLQIWNEELSPTRRYVLIRVNAEHVVTRVRVVSGTTVAKLDTTGTLTTKYQAKAKSPPRGCVLVSAADTQRVQDVLRLGSRGMPTGVGRLMPIDELFERLVSLCGRDFPDPGAVQERNRGAALHRIVCEAIEGGPYNDCGQFPDIRSQLLEVKLQLASTIDLGLVSPDSTEFIEDMPKFQHCDVRYAVCYAESVGNRVLVRHVVLTTGQDFFGYFQRFGGLVRNAKLQIPLTGNFFG